MEPLRQLADNQVLAALASSDFERLAPHAVRVMLAQNFVANEADTEVAMVYFPVGAVLSVISLMENGQGIETCTVGRENAYGLAAALGSTWAPERVICQVAGPSFQIPLARVKAAAAASPGLRELFMRFVQAGHAQTAQSVACNVTHSLEARLCRWLLMSQDRAGLRILPLTHEFIGFMLGVQRSTVTIAARSLQAAGLIRYKRGNIEILDREGLEAGACECYAVVNHKHGRLLGRSIAKS